MTNSFEWKHETLICPKWGKRINDETVVFCSACGALLDSSSSVPAEGRSLIRALNLACTLCFACAVYALFPPVMTFVVGPLFGIRDGTDKYLYGGGLISSIMVGSIAVVIFIIASMIYRYTSRMGIPTKKHLIRLWVFCTCNRDERVATTSTNRLVIIVVKLSIWKHLSSQCVSFWLSWFVLFLLVMFLLQLFRYRPPLHSFAQHIPHIQFAVV